MIGVEEDVDSLLAPPPPQRDERMLIEVSVLGSLRIIVSGSEVYQGLRAKAREMLAYLTLHPRGVTGEAIATALWPDANGRSSKQRFQTALGNLRSTLRTATGASDDEQLIERIGERYRLDASWFVCDLWEFQAGATTKGDVAALNRSLDLYCGDLVDGERYDWAYATREQIRLQALDLAGTLARLLEGSGDSEMALGVLDRAVMLDPYNEELCRRLMEAQVKNGRGDLVMATYRVFEARLEEIDLEPQSETERLAYSLATAL